MALISLPEGHSANAASNESAQPRAIKQGLVLLAAVRQVRALYGNPAPKNNTLYSDTNEFY